MLSCFSFALVRAQRRMSVRVELCDPGYAYFTTAMSSVSGRPPGRSLTGISIMKPENPKLPLSKNGELALTGPIGTITVPASRLKKTPTPLGFCLAFEIEATGASEMRFTRYIFLCQVAIIKELRDYPWLKA